MIWLFESRWEIFSIANCGERTAHLDGIVATVGFPDPSLQCFAPKLAKGEIASLAGLGDDPCHFQINLPVQLGKSGGALAATRSLPENVQ
jgi:hypothetical protein